MAQFTAELKAADTSFVKPITDKSGYTSAATAASAVESIGKLGFEAAKGYQLAEAETEYEQLATEIKQADAQYSMQDVLAIEDFGKRMQAFQTMAAQGKRSDEMKLRAETLLKQQVARMPGLEQEFRKSAANIIGIDPAGVGVKTAFANMATEEANAERFLQQIGTDSVSLGMNVGEVYSEAGQAKYQALANQRSMMMQGEMELKTYQNAVALGAAKQSQLDLASSNYFRDNQIGLAQRSNTTASKIMANALGGADITAQSVAAMSQEDRTRLITQLKDARDNSQSIYDRYSKGFKQRDEFEDISGRVLRPFDDMIGLLEGKTSLDQIQNWNKFETQGIVNGLLKGPAARKALVFKELVGQTNLPAGLDAELLAEATKFLQGAMPDPTSPAPVITAPSPEEQAEVTAPHMKALGSTLGNLLNQQDGSQESKDYAIQTISNIASMLEDGDNYKPQVLDSFIDVLSNPQSADSFRKALQTNPNAKASINGMMAKHAQRSGSSVAALLDRQMDRWALDAFVSEIDGVKTRPFIYPELDGGSIVVKMDESAMQQFSANNEMSPNEYRNMSRMVKQDAAKMTNGPVASLNKLINATSNLYNQSTDIVAPALVQKAGRLNQFIQLPMPTREQEMGLGTLDTEKPRQVVRDESGKLRFK